MATATPVGTSTRPPARGSSRLPCLPADRCRRPPAWRTPAAAGRGRDGRIGTASMSAEPTRPGSSRMAGWRDGRPDLPHHDRRRVARRRRRRSLHRAEPGRRGLHPHVHRRAGPRHGRALLHRGARPRAARHRPRPGGRRDQVEESRPDELYPHIYGELEPSAVIRVVPFGPEPDGSYVVPSEALGDASDRSASTSPPVCGMWPPLAMRPPLASPDARLDGPRDDRPRPDPPRHRRDRHARHRRRARDRRRGARPRRAPAAEAAGRRWTTSCARCTPRAAC